MEKNVLLLCLSMTKIKNGKVGVYTYAQSEERNVIEVDGYLTNEAPAKSIIQKLAASGERLDDIIVICSQSVRRPVINEETRDKVGRDKEYKEYIGLQKNVLPEDRDKFKELTHIELYKSLIWHFSRELKDTYKKSPIKFHEISVPDDTSGAEVARAAVEAADSLKIEEGGKLNLYIDYNGGQRYMAFMIVSIANLAKVRGARIKEILTMNYEQKDKDKEYVPIQNMRDVFGCVDLVAGVHEYINYGRTRMLDAYFTDAPDGTNEIKGILKDMREFSYAMQMCNISDVRKKSNVLKKRLEKYRKEAEQKKEESPEQADIYEVLFLYVVTDILEGYRILFESDWTENLPEIIKWCIKRDYIQQALTFYAEQMPAYFYHEHKYKKGSGSVYVFAPTEAEKYEYKKYLEFCLRYEKIIENFKKESRLELEEKLFSNFKEEFRTSKDKFEVNKNTLFNICEKIYNKEYKVYNKGYSWFIKFINFSHTYRYDNYEFRFGDLMYKKLRPRNVKYYTGNQKLCDVDKINQINKNVDKLMGAMGANRARSDLNEDQLKQVLVDYFQAKELRNIFNHAAEKRSDNIQYEKIRIFVNKAMDDLREFMNEAVNGKHNPV